MPNGSIAALSGVGCVQGMSEASPVKAKRGGGGRTDGKLATHLRLQREGEIQSMDKTKELLAKLMEREPKEENRPFDEAAAREEILERQRRTKRAPGDPIYVPLFSDKGQRTDTDQLPKNGSRLTTAAKAEKARREAVRALNLSLRISVNGRLLTREDGSVLEARLVPRPGYSLSFTVGESIQLAPSSALPELTVHVFESNYLGMVASEIAQVFVPISAEGLDDRGDPIVFQDSRPFDPAPLPDGLEGLSASLLDASVVSESGTRAARQRYITGHIFLRLQLSPAGPPSSEHEHAINVAGPAGEGGGAPELPPPRRRRRAAAAEAERGGRDDKKSVVGAGRLKKMIQMNQLDPNDPRNRHLLDLLSQSKEVESETLVRMDPLLETVLIGDQLAISAKSQTVVSSRWVGTQYLTCPANMRHKLLMAREKNPAAFAGGSKTWPDTAVPLREEEIDASDDRREEFWDRVYAPEFPEADEDAAKVDNKKVQKLMHFKAKIQEQVRKAKAKEGGKRRRAYRLEDVVHQPELPLFHVPDLIAAIRNLFRKRSVLRPQQNKPKQTSAHPSGCSISITIQRAHNLPNRRLENPAAIQKPEASPLECLVKASFGKHSARTPVVKGNAPAWNARIDLPLVPPNDNWAPSNLMKIGDTLHLNVPPRPDLPRPVASQSLIWQVGAGVRFQDVREARLGRLSQEAREALARCAPPPLHHLARPGALRLLTLGLGAGAGSVSFPFSTIYTATGKGRIDGVFELDAPPHAIGYTRAKEDTRGSLQVCVALDPPLAQPSEREQETKGRLPGQAALDARVHAWIGECSRPAHCKHRTFEALGRSLHRDWVLATRFVAPQAPPQAVYAAGEPVEVQMAQLARFVSLVPFLEDWNLEEGGDEVPNPPPSLPY